ncbi:MAG: type II and III secretion system protein [Armatimonadota bacterium]|nr:MAG: type II and III secretion system protein [Armatimonadota bacterium]
MGYRGWRKLNLLLLIAIWCGALALAATPNWAASGEVESEAASDEASDDSGEEGKKEGKEEKEKKPKAAEPEITFSAEGVTVHAVNVYAHRLLTRLAEQTDLQLVVDDAIKDRKVTIHLSKKPPEAVLNHIVAAYGFSCGCVDGVYMISEGIPRKPSSYLLSDIKSIPTQYVQANSAKGLLPVFLQDHVKVNYEQNAVVLSAPTDVLDKFEEDIRQFDIPAAQIMLEILVVEFTDWDAAQRDLAVRWQNAGRAAEWGTLDLPEDNPYLPQRSLGELVLRGITDLPTEFRAELEALVSTRRAQVRAAPRIATVSGRWASFFVGIQRYLRQPIETEDGDTSNYIDAGVRLGVRPWTGDGKEIICSISPEVSTLSALDPVTGLPEKITRTAETMVRVRDGQTIVIGGLRQEEERVVRTKVPVLGDLPLLGSAFRSKHKVVTRTDLVIFITPRVLSLTGHLPAEEEQELRDRFLEAE